MQYFVVIFICSVLYTPNISAQDPSVYIHVDLDSTSFFSIKKIPKAPNDPDPRISFPYNGGKSYHFEISNGRYKEFCYFTFLNWHMDSGIIWPWFEAHKVHIDTLNTLDFRDSNWFKSKPYGDILNEFAIGDKTIYLIDSSEIKGDSTYMVRVRFYHPADE